MVSCDSTCHVFDFATFKRGKLHSELPYKALRDERANYAPLTGRCSVGGKWFYMSGVPTMPATLQGFPCQNIQAFRAGIDTTALWDAYGRRWLDSYGRAIITLEIDGLAYEVEDVYLVDMPAGVQGMLSRVFLQDYNLTLHHSREYRTWIIPHIP
ncbi:hypothetical protein BGW39_001342, partial [Mortierella sp. 14UC]